MLDLYKRNLCHIFPILLLTLALFLQGCGGSSSGSGGPQQRDLSFSSTENGWLLNLNIGPGQGQPTVFSPGPVALALNSIEVTPNSVALIPGGTADLVVRGHFSDGTSAILPGNTGVTLTFVSQNSGVVTVSSLGSLTAVELGNTSVEVRASFQGRTVTAPVTVAVSDTPSTPIAYLMVANPTPNSGGGSVSSFAVYADGTLSLADNNTNVNRPIAIGKSLDGSFIYAGSIFGFDGETGPSLSTFAVDRTLGSLTYQPPVTPVVAGGAQRTVTHPNGSYLYVAEFSGAVTGFLIQGDGTLVPNPAATTPLVTNTGLSQPVMTPAGDLMYMPDFNDDGLVIIDVDGTTGELSLTRPVLTTGDGPAACSLSPDGQLLYLSNFNAGTVAVYDNASTGALTLLHNQPASSGAGAQAVHPTLPVLYVASSGDLVESFTTEPTGLLTPVGSAQPSGYDPTQLLLHPTGEYLYALCRGTTPSFAAAISTYAINPGNGELTWIQDYNFPQLSYPVGAVMVTATP